MRNSNVADGFFSIAKEKMTKNVDRCKPTDKSGKKSTKESKGKK